MKVSSYMALTAVVLGLLAVVMSLGAAMALLDIAQGKEQNLTLEWIVVWVALILMVIAQVVSIAAILGLLRRRSRAGGSKDPVDRARP